jgi:hypothetical protein
LLFLLTNSIAWGFCFCIKDPLYAGTLSYNSKLVGDLERPYSLRFLIMSNL